MFEVRSPEMNGLWRARSQPSIYQASVLFSGRHRMPPDSQNRLHVKPPLFAVCRATYRACILAWHFIPAFFKVKGLLSRSRFPPAYPAPVALRCPARSTACSLPQTCGQRVALIQSHLEAVKRAGIRHLVADHKSGSSRAASISFWNSVLRQRNSAVQRSRLVFAGNL